MFMSYILPDEIMCIPYSQMSSEKSENIYIIFHVSFINNGKGGALIVKNKFIYTKVKIYIYIYMGNVPISHTACI